MKLNRVLLINWLYYTKELLNFDQITLLSGKTGHGKSAFIDALQIVVLGETRDKNFNKSSGNIKTDRKLIDYLKGRNDEGNFKRKGNFSSHICLEFMDENQQKFCYGITFDCDSVTNEKSYRYYFT